ncbi:hypothetical protein [Rathayibacter sp. AY1G1]|uniref:hypothetical protein n=1 Tax=Rathayibacter sp. AY1G1 TaxID=2080564 RepID=UPI0011AFF171|nr:hypothetical protein [Rathayibacter sp. AY1G1]
MGVWSEFEEKEFETLANVAFVSEQIMRKRSVQVFSPGQVLEKTLGFDFATHVEKYSPIHRRLFGATPGAPGATNAQLTQLAVPLSQSTSFLNVFIQYKRPEFFKRGHRSTLWDRREEYLRFTVSESSLGGGYHFDQVTALDQLSQSLGASALVRYACPTIWTKNDLYGLFGANSLLENSVFVSPDKLIDVNGRDPYHRRWTFQTKRPDVGMPNPDGRLMDVENGEAFSENLEKYSTNLPRNLEYADIIRSEANRVQKVRSLADVRKSKLRSGDRARAVQEDDSFARELQKLPSQKRSAVEASLEIAKISRDLGVKWMVVASS